MTKKRHILGGGLIVAGTSIGAGALAIPVETSLGGFLPAFFYYTLVWLFMTCTGLLFLEISLRMPKDSNLVSMFSQYLGKVGKIAAWVLYLFFFYSLLVAYISVGGDLLRLWSNNVIARNLAYFLFFLILAPVVYLGTKTVEKVNIFLMIGLVLSYFLFVFFGIQEVQLEYLSLVNWKQGTLALPILFAAFGYQSVIPTLTSYLKKDAKSLRKAIVLGTTVTFIIYTVWELVILGSTPVEGVNGLAFAKENGLSAIHPLTHHTGVRGLSTVSNIFGFCAVTTSFLGVSLGFIDFLADGLSMSKKGMNRFILATFTFFPPLLVTWINPGLFLIALKYAGGIGSALLLGLLPVLMVWASRYYKKDMELIQLKGGKSLLSLLLFFVFFELSIEIFLEFLLFSST